MWIMASETSMRISQSQTSLRHRIIQPKVRSTTQRLGKTFVNASFSDCFLLYAGIRSVIRMTATAFVELRATSRVPMLHVQT